MHEAVGEGRVSSVRLGFRHFSTVHAFFFGKVTAVSVLCCFALLFV